MVTPFLPFKKEWVVAYLAKNCVGERMGIALSCSTREPYVSLKMNRAQPSHECCARLRFVAHITVGINLHQSTMHRHEVFAII